MRLVGTTKPTIAQIRDRSHWNSANLVPQDPVTLGLCKQTDLDAEVEKAAKRVAKERKAMGLPPIEAAGTLLPTAETTGYEQPEGDTPKTEEAVPTAANIFGEQNTAEPTVEEVAEADETARVFAKLQGMSSADEAEADNAVAATSEPEPVADNKHLQAVKKYAPDCNEAAVAGIIKHLGIALRSKDASLVACSSNEELDRVRESWCKNKLALSEDDDALDAMIKSVCETMKDDSQKDRVAFYYLLAQMNGKVDELA